MKDTVAVCPGSFDPITLGHLDIITRASRLFSRVVVVVMTNDAKKPLFSLEDRVLMIQKVIDDCHLDNVVVDASDELLADYCRRVRANAIVKGLRAVSDFEYEFQMALTNKKLNADADTMFLTTSAENMYLSSSLVKLLAAKGGDIREFVPPVVHNDIVKKFTRKDEQI